MRVVCETCGQGKPLSKGDSSFFTMGNPFFCSLECFKKQVEQTSLPPPDPDLLVYVPDAQRMSDGTSYSPKLGTAFRSGYEVVVAEWMILEAGWKVHYEPFLVKIGDNKHYIPDFYLPDFGVILEVKGLWLGAGRRKFRVASELLGMDRLLLVPPVYRKWFKQSASSYL